MCNFNNLIINLKCLIYSLYI
uniref:Uncharacterized protein n=1 Tax=Anguilla anguilla TaxID=7936 RepID=A0A0E9U1Q9_ANGAN